MRWRTLLVIAVALLAVTAMPASAQNASAVASKHTTFGTGSAGEPDPTTLQNMTRFGSGQSASVGLEPLGLLGIEDGDITEYGGATGSYSVVSSSTTSPAGQGSYILEGSDNNAALIDTDTTVSQGDTFTVNGYVSGGNEIALFFGAQNEVADKSNGYSGYYLKFYENNDVQLIRLDDGSTATSQSTTSSSFPTNEWVSVEVAWGSGGTITATVTDASGTQLAQVSLTDSTYQSGGIGVETYGGTTYYDDPSAGAYPDTGTYISAPHDAEQIQQAWTNLSLSNASATVYWQEDGDGDGAWTNVTSTTYTTTGNYTADLSATQSDHWRVRVDVEVTGADPVARLHDEGQLFEAASPSLFDPEPPDGMQIEGATGNVSINVTDADFGLAQGDSVTVSATADGSSLGSTTLTSNGTASFSYSSETGENRIEWTATDAYDNSETFTQTFETPENLYIRPEGDPDALVDGSSVSIEVRFYAENNIYTRTTSDGIVNLAGLPADARFAVVVSADGYYRRRVIIDSLFEQQTVYLLNESASAVEKKFVLNDVSGNFPAESTRLYIQRSINNSTDYRTVAADYFGATSAFSTYLQTDQRYRVIVENDQGDRRTLGSYTPVAAGVETLKIEGVGLYQESQEGYIANSSTRFVSDTQRQVVVRYRDPEAATSEYTVRVYERGNASNVTYQESVSGPVQNYSAYVDVANGTSYVVNWSATRNGQQIGGVRPVGGGDLGLRIPLPAQWLGTVGLVILVFVGSLAGERYATHLALSVVAFAGVLMYLAVIDIFLPLWWAGLLISAGGHLAQRRPAA